ncbi:MAG TPA: hypothetical protein VK188_15245 [Holophaga sp.]|nr:hypothetical protein [Holophaga sp.]
MSGLSPASPRWVLEGGTSQPRGALVQISDLFARTTLASHGRGMVKRPAGASLSLAGPKLPGQDGDGPDALQPALTAQAQVWFAQAPASPGEGPDGGERIPRGLAPEEGGKRGPPTA